MADNSVYKGASIPAGGAADQVLTKDTGADFDYSWQNPGNVFGSEFEQGENLPEGTTSSGTWVQHWRYSSANLPAGNYMLFWYIEAGSTTDKMVAHRLQRNDANVAVISWKQKNGSDSAMPYIPFTGQVYLPSISGVQNFDFDFEGENSAFFRNGRIQLWRVS